MKYLLRVKAVIMRYQEGNTYIKEELKTKPTLENIQEKQPNWGGTH